MRQRSDDKTFTFTSEQIKTVESFLALLLPQGLLCTVDNLTAIWTFLWLITPTRDASVCSLSVCGLWNEKGLVKDLAHEKCLVSPALLTFYRRNIHCRSAVKWQMLYLNVFLQGLPNTCHQSNAFIKSGHGFSLKTSWLTDVSVAVSLHRYLQFQFNLHKGTRPLQ